jgi:hypothetical protein
MKQRNPNAFLRLAVIAFLTFFVATVAITFIQRGCCTQAERRNRARVFLKAIGKPSLPNLDWKSISE